MIPCVCQEGLLTPSQAAVQGREKIYPPGGHLNATLVPHGLGGPPPTSAGLQTLSSSHLRPLTPFLGLQASSCLLLTDALGLVFWERQGAQRGCELVRGTQLASRGAEIQNWSFASNPRSPPFILQCPPRPPTETTTVSTSLPSHINGKGMVSPSLCSESCLTQGLLPCREWFLGGKDTNDNDRSCHSFSRRPVTKLSDL